MQVKFLLLICSILFTSFSLNAQQEDHSIVRGRITDERNKPLELVNISIKGLPGGTVSDKQGKYEIHVPSNEKITLIFSFVGYERQEFEISVGETEITMVWRRHRLAAVEADTAAQELIEELADKGLDVVVLPSSGAEREAVWRDLAQRLGG